MTRVLVLSLLLTLLQTSAFAANWFDCRAITDATARLACYDALAEQLAKPAAMPHDNAVPVAPTAPAAVDAATPAAGSMQAAAAVTAPTLVAKQTAADFGLEKQAEKAQIEAIQSRIMGTFRGWEPKSKITLENGQVWQIVDGSRGTYSLESPAVSIERGVFGSFFLKIEGANRSPKVKRLK